MQEKKILFLAFFVISRRPSFGSQCRRGDPVSKTQRDWKAVNQQEVDQYLNSPEFIHRGQCGCGVPIHSFRIPNEQLEGRLRPCRYWDRADRAKTAEIHLSKDHAVAIRLSGMLWRAIQDNKLWGRWVRITYKGSIRGKFPNALKIYLVEVDKGVITEDWETIDSQVKDSKNRKSRNLRKIRRPKAIAVN